MYVLYFLAKEEAYFGFDSLVQTNPSEGIFGNIQLFDELAHLSSLERTAEAKRHMKDTPNDRNAKIAFRSTPPLSKIGSEKVNVWISSQTMYRQAMYDSSLQKRFRFGVSTIHRCVPQTFEPCLLLFGIVMLVLGHPELCSFRAK